MYGSLLDRRNGRRVRKVEVWYPSLRSENSDKRTYIVTLFHLSGPELGPSPGGQGRMNVPEQRTMNVVNNEIAYIAPGFTRTKTSENLEQAVRSKFAKLRLVFQVSLLDPKSAVLLGQHTFLHYNKASYFFRTLEWKYQNKEKVSVKKNVHSNFRFRKVHFEEKLENMYFSCTRVVFWFSGKNFRHLSSWRTSRCSFVEWFKSSVQEQLIL